MQVLPKEMPMLQEGNSDDFCAELGQYNWNSCFSSDFPMIVCT